MYEQIYDFTNLKNGFRASNHGKIHNPAANKFEIRLLEALVLLSNQLKNKTYTTDKTTKFKIYYPKERDIESNSFKDKVVQHSLCDNILYDAIQPSFIYDNYASQIGKGREFGLDRLKKHLRHYFFSRKSANEKRLKELGLPLITVEEGNYADGWVLKCDIRKYFANVKHEIVLEKLKKYIQDEDVIWISDVILKTVNNPSLPIGHQTSQLFSLMVLNDFDHMIKEKLHIKYYGRYVDDFYLIHEDKEYLKYCLKVMTDYLNECGLELNNKTQIFPLKNGIDFIGFHTYLTDTGKVVQKLRKRSKDNMRRKLKKFKKKLDANEMDIEKIQQIYTSWRAYAKYGDTYHLIQNMDKLYNSLFEDFIKS